MRFTLGKMFWAIAMLAVAFAGMMYRDHFWASVVSNATLALFIWVGMTAVRTSGSKRAAAIWFVAVGTLYLVLTTCPLFAKYGEYALTNYPLALIARWRRIGYGEDYPLSNIVITNFIAPENNNNVRVLFLIGHCIFSWLFALLAAWFAGRIYDRREWATKEAV